MRAYTVTLRMPHGSAAVTRSITANTDAEATRAIAEAVREFARSRGVSPYAIDYSLREG